MRRAIEEHLGSEQVSRVIYGAIIGMALVVVLEHQHPTAGVAAATLVATGLAVALALQDTLSNLFSGLQVVASRQVRLGDYVKLESGEEGYVTDITWRNTSIRALPNNMVIVPNSKLASTLVTNYYQPEREMAVLVQVCVGYQSDLKKLVRLE